MFLPFLQLPLAVTATPVETPAVTFIPLSKCSELERGLRLFCFSAKQKEEKTTPRGLEQSSQTLWPIGITGRLVKRQILGPIPRDSYSQDLSWGLIICISNKNLVDSDVSARTTGIRGEGTGKY